MIFMEIKPWPTSGTDNCMVNDVPTLKCLETVFANILVASTALITVTLFIMFIIGALQYLTSGGNPEKLKKAQGTLRYAIVGTVVFISAFLILTIIDVLFLGGNGILLKLKIP